MSLGGRRGRLLVTGMITTVLAAAVTTGTATAKGAAPAASSAAVSATTSGTTGRTDRLSVLMSGDVLVHTTLVAQAKRDAVPGGPSLNFDRMLAAQKPRVSTADLAICHLETPIAPAGGPYTGYPLFKAPAHVVTSLRRVGYDACTTASNHSLDDGQRGIKRTLDVLDSNKLGHTGTARTSTERNRPLVRTVQGVKVGIVSTTFSTNGIPVPRDRRWSVNTLDRTALVEDVKRTKAAGAEIVVVAVHAGTEYSHVPNAQQEQIRSWLHATRLVDAVYFHHAHVVEPVEKVGYRWVAWGLGNTFATSTTKYNKSTGEQVMTRFNFERQYGTTWRVRSVAVIPGYSPNVAPYRWVDLVTAAQDPSLSSSARSSYAARARHVRSIVGAHGGFSDGVYQASPVR